MVQLPVDCAVVDARQSGQNPVGVCETFIMQLRAPSFFQVACRLVNRFRYSSPDRPSDRLRIEESKKDNDDETDYRKNQSDKSNLNLILKQEEIIHPVCQQNYRRRGDKQTNCQSEFQNMGFEKSMHLGLDMPAIGARNNVKSIGEFLLEVFQRILLCGWGSTLVVKPQWVDTFPSRRPMELINKLACALFACLIPTYFA